jgi:cytochrome P450
LIAKLLRERRLVKDSSFEDKIKNELYTYTDLINEMTTFFFAGTDTTSNVMASLMYKLLQHREV